MATVPYSTIEGYLQSLTGIDSPTTEEKTWWKAALNRRIRAAYESSRFWPRYTKEELRYAGFDNVVPTQSDGFTEIDTFHKIWDVNPRLNTSVPKEYDFIVGSEGAQLLNLAEGSYLEEQYTLTGTSTSSSLLEQKSGTAKSVSFWMKWDGSVDYDSTTDENGDPLAVGDGWDILITSPNSTFTGGFRIESAVGPTYNMGTLWGRGASEFANWWVDGQWQGTMQDFSVTPKSIDTWLDGEWHLFCFSQDFTSNETTLVDNIYWELNNSFNDKKTKFTFGDWRIYSNKMTTAQAQELYNSPAGAIDNPIVFASNQPQYFVSYKGALTTTYGDGAGEESNIPLEFFEYGYHGAYADWLRAEGQTDKARVEEQFANEHLQRQLEKISYTNGSPYIWSRYSTHSARQPR